jgi:hypothetical protein
MDRFVGRDGSHGERCRAGYGVIGQKQGEICYVTANWLRLWKLQSPCYDKDNNLIPTVFPTRTKGRKEQLLHSGCSLLFPSSLVFILGVTGENH